MYLLIALFLILAALAFGVYMTRRILTDALIDASAISIRATIRYVVIAVLSLLATLFTYALSPFLALTAGSDGNLPRWLYWFQTFDNTLDAGWKVQGNHGTYLVDGVEPTGIKRWWYRVCWLCRNPVYGFDYWPFGVAVDISQWRVVRDDDTYFSAIGPNGKFCIKSRDARPLKLGWKIWAYYDDTLHQWRDADYAWGPAHRAPVCISVV